MELNQVLFPAPPVKYTPESLQGEIIYIPKHLKFSEAFHNQLNAKYKELRKAERILKDNE